MASPMQACAARPEDLATITAWITDPAIYEAAFGLAAKPEPAWVRRSILLVENNLGIELQPVRFWSLVEGGQLQGFAIDFGWDAADDTAREVDFALPRGQSQRPRRVVEALAAIIHRLFAEHGATEIWGRVRQGAAGQGFPRLFQLIGGTARRQRLDALPTSGAKIARIYYACTPASFYASPMGRRLHAAPGAGT